MGSFIKTRVIVYRLLVYDIQTALIRREKVKGASTKYASPVTGLHRLIVNSDEKERKGIG